MCGSRQALKQYPASQGDRLIIRNLLSFPSSAFDGCNCHTQVILKLQWHFNLQFVFTKTYWTVLLKFLTVLININYSLISLNNLYELIQWMIVLPFCNRWYSHLKWQLWLSKRLIKEIKGNGNLRKGCDCCLVYLNQVKCQVVLCNIFLFVLPFCLL